MYKLGTTSFFAIAAFTTLLAAPASAQDTTPPPMPATNMPAAGTGFGSMGQLALGSDFQFGLVRSSQSMGGGTTVTFTLLPGADYFIADHISIGGQIGFQYQSTDPGGSASTFVLGPRAGYNHDLTDKVSIWPRLALNFSRVSVTLEGGGMSQSSSGNVFTLEIFAPFLYHLAPHVFLGLGPVFSTDLVRSFEGMGVSKVTSFGLATAVGGWFNP